MHAKAARKPLVAPEIIKNRSILRCLIQNIKIVRWAFLRHSVLAICHTAGRSVQKSAGKATSHFYGAREGTSPEKKLSRPSAHEIIYYRDVPSRAAYISV